VFAGELRVDRLGHPRGRRADDVNLTPPVTRELPAGFRVVLDEDVRVRDGGSVLIGGSPLRLMRLNARAQAVVAWWRTGAFGDDSTTRRLARTLLDAGLAHPRPGPGAPAADEVTVVIPVRDRPAALARCLASLGPCGGVLVVDDGSRDPEATALVASTHGARVVHRRINGGPAAARNTGLAHCDTPYVAFVDSDCRPEPGWLDRLLPHFRDPAVALVAPRIVPTVDARGWLAPYERARSALDLGPREGPVVPRSRIAYVPSATLVARRAALGRGFTEAMRTGEDVDLVWRLHEAGWTVRYEPAALVRHDHRARVRDWAARRYAYGEAAAPLAVSHPGQVPPVVLSRWTLATWALALSGRPRLAVAATGVAAGLFARQLPLRHGRLRESVRLVGTGTVLAADQLARAATRTWFPLALPLAVLSRRARFALGAAVLVPPLSDFARTRPGTDVLRFTVAHLVDDLAYGAGVWSGSLANRTAAPLLPQFPSRRRRAGWAAVTRGARRPQGSLDGR